MQTKKNDNFISIIVPIYNRSSFLPACIDSIVNQSYPYLDIILIDDGSTDNSLAVCRDYEQKDKRIRVFSVPNSGVGTARNTGIKHARGVFIQFVDSDDTIKPDMCKTLMEEQRKNNADLVICGFDNIDAHGNHLFYECAEKPVNDISEFFNNFGDLLEHNLLRSPVNKLYKKEIITVHELAFSSDFNIAEDALFNLDYYRCIQSVSVITQDFYNCLNHSNTERLTQKLHTDYFYIQNIFFTKLIELLTKKQVYSGYNKEIVIIQYARIVKMGINMLVAHNQNLDFDAVYRDLLYSIFPPQKEFDYHLYKISTWIMERKEKKLLYFFSNPMCARKINAIAYTRKNTSLLKKIYGLLKVCFWQCAELLYI